MRKLSTVTLLFSVLALFTFGGSALAGSCGGKAAIGSSCGSVKGASASCEPASCVSSAELSCHGKDAAACKSDPMISSYMNVKKGLHMSCTHSTSNAVSIWKSDLRKLIKSEETPKNEARLKDLAEVLDSWPSDLEAQRVSFQQLSNWTIGYMEMFPERCQGAEVKSCGKSGHRWVETQDVAGDPYSS